MRFKHNHQQQHFIASFFLAFFFISHVRLAYGVSFGERASSWLTVPREWYTTALEALPTWNNTNIIGSTGLFGSFFIKDNPQNLKEALEGRWRIDIRTFSLSTGERLPPSTHWPSHAAIMNILTFPATEKPEQAKAKRDMWDPLCGYFEFIDDKGYRLREVERRFLRLETRGDWKGTFTELNMGDGKLDGRHWGPSDFQEWFSFRLHPLHATSVWSTVEVPKNDKKSDLQVLPMLTILDRNHFVLNVVEKKRGTFVTITALRTDTILPDSKLAKYGPTLGVGLVYFAIKYVRRGITGDLTSSITKRGRLIAHAAQMRHRALVARRSATAASLGAALDGVAPQNHVHNE